MDDIFGEENFIDTMIWKKRYGGGAKEKYLVSLHEYILVYAKDETTLEELFVPLTEESVKRYYTQKDLNFHTRGPYRTHPLEATKSMGERPNLVFPIRGPDGTEILPKRQWLWSKDRVKDAIRDGNLEFVRGKDGEWTVHTKQYLKDENGHIRQGKAFSLIDDIYTQHGTNEIIDIFGNAQIFPFPKPSELIKRLIEITSKDKNELILDFFSGSCATANAVIDLNKEDGGNRKFIMVQLPEPCEESSEAFKAGYKTIADIGKERIRRVIKRNKEGQKEKGEDLFDGGKSKQDLGFKVFKLDSSNFKIWDGEIKDDAKLQKQIELAIDHVDPDSKPEDILHEILLKAGFVLTTKIAKLELAGKTVYSVEDNALLICLDGELNKGVITAMAKLSPARVVCLDQGFKNNDQLKTNAVQIMKSHGVEDFRTV